MSPKNYQVGVAGGIYVDPFFTHYLHKTVAWLLQDPATGPSGFMIFIIMVIYSAIITIYAEPQLCWVGVVSALAAFTPFGGQTLLSIFADVWIIYYKQSSNSIF